MPKQNSNPFMLFLKDFREEQRKKGIVYSNITEAIKAADPVWRDCPTTVRKKYDNMAKRTRERETVKYTSHGVPISFIEKEQREQQELEQKEKKDIEGFVTKNCHLGSPTLDIFIMDVNCYCKAVTDYIVGESTVLRFSVNDGIKDMYHETINPGNIPMGYSFEVKKGAEELGLDMPDVDAAKSNYMKILANIVDYLKQGKHSLTILPPIYTMPDKVVQVQNFITQMCAKTGEDETLFRVYKLDTLFFAMMNALKKDDDDVGFPRETLANSRLKSDVFRYSPHIACERHEEKDKAVECTMSRVRRWAYTILDSLCPVANVVMEPGKHVPEDYDLENILIYQKAKTERAGPSIAAHVQAMSACSISTKNTVKPPVAKSSKPNKKDANAIKQENMRMPKAVNAEGIKQENVRTPRDANEEAIMQENMRMPKALISIKVPELSEEDFPPLAPGPQRRQFRK